MMDEKLEFEPSMGGTPLNENETPEYTVVDGPGPTSDSSHRGSILIYDEYGYDSADPEEWVDDWIAPARFAPYLDACDGDTDKALDLYEWNMAVGQILDRDISHFEIALRNAYDRVMCDRWGEDWLVDRSSPVQKPILRKNKRGRTTDLNKVSRKEIKYAKAGLPRNHTHDALVSALMLGFWVHLSDRTREAEIWRTGLYKAWPKGTNRAELHARLLGVLRTRNRVAHPERQFDPRGSCPPPTVAERDAIDLFRMLCPGAADWAYGNDNETPLTRFLGQYPAPPGISI